MPGLLHVTNGDSALKRIEGLGLGGRVIAWRDALHDGPVPEGLDDGALREVRAGFLAGKAGTPATAIQAAFAERDELLATAAARSEVVLWFEHDLYDQLQLLQVLDSLATRGGASAFLVQTDDYLGGADAGTLRAWYERRKPVSSLQVSLARDAWQAFRSSDPTRIEQILHRDTSALPFLHAAFLRHLEEFPALGSGLSRTERQLLEAVGAGCAEPHAVFEASQASEQARFLGDAIAFDRLAELARGSGPLVLGPPYELTADGAAVLEGGADRIALTGLDRWLGGVHLAGGRIWRWDAAELRLRLS